MDMIEGLRWKTERKEKVCHCSEIQALATEVGSYANKRMYQCANTFPAFVIHIFAR